MTSGPLSLTTAQPAHYLRPSIFADVAQPSLKQPLVPGIRVLGTVDLVPFPFFVMAKKPATSPAREESQEKRMPEKTLRIDDVSASIFRRVVQSAKQRRTFFSVSFSRSYKDSAGVWRYSKSFDLEDLGKIVSLCQQAEGYIRGELSNAQQAA